MKVSWTEHKANEEVLQMVDAERKMMTNHHNTLYLLTYLRETLMTYRLVGGETSGQCSS